MTRFDPLTNLLRRDAFLEALRTDRRDRAQGVVIMLDVDHFKLINDRYGHFEGDEVLREIANRLRGALPADALLCRLGGDEFVAFVPGGLSAAKELADDCLTVARQPIFLSGGAVDITLSAGVATLLDGAAVGDVFRSADAAMYAAKAKGRDRVLVFDEDTQGVIGARRELAAAVATLQERNRELQRLAQTDALTGLNNRQALDQVLDQTCGRPEDTWTTCSVAFLDIDHFGSYNKEYGDSQGDEVLQRVAKAIRDNSRKHDIVFRKGGEELVVVLPHAAEKEARAAAERMRAAVHALAIPHAGSQAASVVTVTVGVTSTSGSEEVTVRQLMERASTAAMRAKVSSARNLVHAV